MLFNIFNMLGSEPKRKRFQDTMNYMFLEIPDASRQDMMQAIVDEYEQHKAAAHDPEDSAVIEAFNIRCLAKISAIYTSISPEQYRWPMTHEAFLDEKAEKLAHVVKTVTPEIGIKTKITPRLLDIGSGDGHMTARVSDKLGAIPTGVDLQSASDQSMWVGNHGTVAQIPIIYYDGVDLIGALKKDTNDYTQLYDVITINHVLHHYPNRRAQVEGLQKAIALLKEGGCVLLSEHDSALDDEFIELQHILFDLKKTLNEKTKEVSLESICQDQLQQYEVEKHEANYFSQMLLNQICKSVGLLPIYNQKRLPDGQIDASKTVFVGYKKITPTLTPAEIQSLKTKSIYELSQADKLPSITGPLILHHCKALATTQKAESLETNQPDRKAGIRKTGPM